MLSSFFLGFIFLSPTLAQLALRPSWVAQPSSHKTKSLSKFVDLSWIVPHRTSDTALCPTTAINVYSTARKVHNSFLPLFFPHLQGRQPLSSLSKCKKDVEESCIRYLSVANFLVELRVEKLSFTVVVTAQMPAICLQYYKRSYNLCHSTMLARIAVLATLLLF